MTLFHITDKVYEIGTSISSNDFGEACFYHQNNPVHIWINDVLDARRDADCPPRKRCIYAFDKPGHCLAFNNNPVLHCYQIEMEAHGGYPMVLTDKLRRVGENYNRLDDLIDEYWHPTKQWKYNEFLGESMVVIGEIKPNKILGIASKMSYDDDRTMADQLFG